MRYETTARLLSERRRGYWEIALMMTMWTLMSSDIGLTLLGTNCDQCVNMVQCCFTFTETIKLIRTGRPGRPPRHSHNSWTLKFHCWNSKNTVTQTRVSVRSNLAVMLFDCQQHVQITRHVGLLIVYSDSHVRGFARSCIVSQTNKQTNKQNYKANSTIKIE